MTWRPLPGDEQTIKPLGLGVQMWSKRLGTGAVGDFHKITQVWDQIVGPQVSARATPVALRQEVLVVGVDDQRWATQMKWLAAGITEKLNQVPGCPDIDHIEIRFRDAQNR